MRVGVALGVLLLIAVSAGAEVDRVSQQIGSLESDGTYRLGGEDVPIHYVIESFLLNAAGFYALDDPESYQSFCEDFGIESAWPSAAALGTLADEIFEEYNARHRGAPDAAAREAVGVVWKPRALGEGFGSLFGELRGDGLRLSFDIFVKTIELRVRAGSTRYSTEPFLRSELEYGAQLFWRGAATTNSEVAEIVARGGSR